MKTAGIIQVLCAILVVACGKTSSEPKAEAYPEAQATPKVEEATIPNTLGFGPLIGDSMAVSVPGAGRYAGSGEYLQQRLITRERTTSNSVKYRSVMELLEDGTVTACFAGKKSDNTSVSKYESRDGKNHEYNSDARWILGAKGTWSIEDGKAKLLLTQVGQGTCTPDSSPESSGTGFELPVELTCYLLGSNNKLPTQTLACRLGKELGRLSTAGLDLGVHTKVGPWSLRYEARDSIDKEKENGPWLLLGPSEGLHTKSREGRRDGTPTLTFTKGALELVEDDWKYQRPTVD